MALNSLFPANIGRLDMSLRIGAGLLVLALGLAGVLGWWGLIGLIPIATGLAGTCPAYAVLGLDTCAPARPDRG